MIVYARLSILRYGANSLALVVFRLSIWSIHRRMPLTMIVNGTITNHGSISSTVGRGQLAVIAELEKVIFHQRINFRVNTRADQNAQNAAKQTI